MTELSERMEKALTENRGVIRRAMLQLMREAWAEGHDAPGDEWGMAAHEGNPYLEAVDE